ncbi:ABC transporter permease [Methyloligella sp. 2.7D]|uniref:cell division protein FtsX n=1 Tax=unclassified Methyloligella TaxID=2625955 RepID=UPI00157CEE13|nr:ABC transporter permease [Methyloligella sp. GL2]QKP76470.1 ABC transporter permease [Methyloligella sp. GL2]
MNASELWAEFKAYPWDSLWQELLPARYRTDSAQILPSASIAWNALTVVIAIMSFLACLTVGTVYMLNQSAAAWVNDVVSEVTVELDPVDTPDIEKKMTLVALFLAKQKGITHVRPLTVQDSADLLEPWLGRSDVIEALPIPRLIAVEIDRTNPPDLPLIAKSLEDNFDGVTLDDHRRWQSEIRGVTRTAAMGGLFILGLVAAATIAVIVSATRSAMVSNREVIEVLHFVGANQGFIAGEFERHFLGLGLRASLVGALSAALVFLLLPLLMHLVGGGLVAAAETRRLFGTGELGIAGYLFFVLVVVVIAGLCMITSRIGVIKVLRDYD